jgi:hypothetical protein
MVIPSWGIKSNIEATTKILCASTYITIHISSLLLDNYCFEIDVVGCECSAYNSEKREKAIAIRTKYEYPRQEWLNSTPDLWIRFALDARPL